jgi:glycosyltransferase involved in cell wall biosynthesis
LKIAVFDVVAAYMMGGAVNYIWALTRFLRQRGHDACLLAGEVPQPVRIYPEVPLQLFPFRRRERFPKFGTRFRKLMERASFGWNARSFLEQGRFDLLSIHKPYDLPLAAWLKKRSTCKVVWRCHGPDFYPGLRYLLKYADAIYCVSEGARQNLLSYYPSLRAEVIYTGVDSKFFTPTPGHACPPNQPPTALYFGRMEGWKGVTYLVKAFSQLGDIPFRGRIVGEGPDSEKVRQLIQESGLQAKVSCEPSLRTREAVRDLLSSVDIVAFTAVAEETMSNAMLEAMAMERAIVASNIGCFAEVLEHDRTALLVQPRDTAGMAAAIRSLFDSPERRAALGLAARQRVLERFEAHQSFLRVEQLFCELCSSG